MAFQTSHPHSSHRNAATIGLLKCPTKHRLLRRFLSEALKTTHSQTLKISSCELGRGEELPSGFLLSTPWMRKSKVLVICPSLSIICPSLSIRLPGICDTKVRRAWHLLSVQASMTADRITFQSSPKCLGQAKIILLSGQGGPLSS